MFFLSRGSLPLNHVAGSSWQNKCRGRGKRGLSSALLHQPQPQPSLICALFGLIMGLYSSFSHSKTSFLLFFRKALKSLQRMCVKVDFETQSFKGRPDFVSPSQSCWSNSCAFLSFILVTGESSSAPTAQAVRRICLCSLPPFCLPLALAELCS